MKHTLITRLALFSLMASLAVAQGKPLLAISLSEEKVNQTQAERSGDADLSYFPGDTIRYMLTASNEGDGLMTQPEVLDPIPAGTSYISGSAQGENARIIYSINQGSTYHNWPVPYTVRNTSGQLVTHEATADMITHIKWRLQGTLEPGESRVLQFMVAVN